MRPFDWDWDISPHRRPAIDVARLWRAFWTLAAVGIVTYGVPILVAMLER